MATVVKDLGAVTAYAYAVAGGYSGTEAEFEALLGNIAEDLSEIENLSVTVTTLPAGSSATASYSNGVLSLGIPKGDKGDKGDTGATGATGPTGNGISTITKTGTSGLVDTYTITFTNGDTTTFTVTNGEDGEVTTAQMNAAIETALEDYAKVDGSYSSLTAGNAEQLVSTVGVNDKTPYLFRTTGGSADVGDRVKLSEITGGTVAWNQLLKEMNSTNFAKSSSSGVIVSIADGVATVTASVQYTGIINTAANRPPIPTGHKVLCSVDVKLSSAVSNAIKAYWNEQNTSAVPASAVTAWQTLANIISWDSTKLSTARVNDYRASDFDSYQIKNSVMFDLTAMFGSTIADYIYSLEQNTAGAGVAWFRKLFPKDYYAYDAGSLLSVKTSAHKEYGFNAYDNTTGKAKVVGGQVYQITGTYTALSLDGTSVTPDASGYFTPSASGEITVTGGNATDTCIHLKWDGERDGEYEPYEEHSYALDDVELRGIPKLDANNNLYYDGDGYAPDGTVTRKYGIVDLGTLEWQMSSAGQFMYENASFDGANDPSGASMICSSVLRGGNAYDGGVDNVICARVRTYKRLWAKCSAYSTADSFTTAMSGVYLVYKLATPTTESADPYQETQICNDFGTEEFVDSRTVPMPVGANALYQANLRAKLEMAPDSPSGNGDYIVRQTDGLNEYVLLEKELPTAPAEDGTYSLKCTVASGTATLSWVSDS